MMAGLNKHQYLSMAARIFVVLTLDVDAVSHGLFYWILSVSVIDVRDKQVEQVAKQRG